MRNFALAAAVAMAPFFINSNAGAEPIDLCGEPKIVEGHPLAGLKTELYWTENGRNMLDNTLLIEKIEGNSVTALYAFGTQPDWYINEPQCTREKGKIKGNMIIFKFPRNKGEARFRIQDGVVVGATYIYDSTNRYPGRINGAIVSAEQ